MAGHEISLNGTEVRTITESEVEVLTAETIKIEDAANIYRGQAVSLVDSTRPTQLCRPILTIVNGKTRPFERLVVHEAVGGKID